MILVEAARHTLDVDVRQLYVTAAAQVLRSAGLFVSEFPVRGHGTPLGGIRVTLPGTRVLVLACELDEAAGTWWWVRPAAAWRCPARDLDWLLTYARTVLSSADEVSS